jgi:hypothetical protein
VEAVEALRPHTKAISAAAATLVEAVDTGAAGATPAEVLRAATLGITIDLIVLKGMEAINRTKYGLGDLSR